MGKKQVPAIRFQGFTDAWEQRKLGDIYIERNERGNAELDILSVSIHHGISQNELDTDELGKSVRRSDDKSLYKHVYYGDLVFNMMRAWQGAIGVVKNEGMVSPAYISAIPDDSVFPEFMDYCLRRKCIINQINNLSYGVTDFRKRLYWEPFTRVTIMMPSVDEQRKITDIFRQLDDLITLHQCKYEKLLKVKKSMLEKMFPRDGADVPEIRFDGFTDAWEQRKLSELAEKTYGGGTPTTSNEVFWNGDIPWIQSSDVVDGKLLGVTPRKHITQSGLNSSAAQLIPKNSIAIITRVGVGKLAFMPYSYATSQDFLSLSKLNTEPFFTVYSCYKKLQSELNSVQGTSIKGITKDELLSKTIMVPEYAEQQQIGVFFSNLDHLITLHQRKLEKLKNIKKSLLEKMFV